MRYTFISILSLCFVFFTQTTHAQANRWYSSDQVARGEVLFQQNCVSCHGSNAEAMPGWQQASGEKSAPPLNGTAHTWHHSMAQLSLTIQQGSKQIGGSMPEFKTKLSEQDTQNIVAYFQSKWPDEIYQPWAEKFPMAATNQLAGANDDITQLLKLRLGTDDVAPATKTDIEGVFQTQLGDKYAYLIEGGRYVFIGDLIDLEQSLNITQISRQDSAKTTLSNIPVSSLVVYPAKGEEKTILNVFTDTSCGYCQKLHKEVGFLQQAGISVHYFPFPRGGSRGPGYADLKSVWCAADQNQAMDIAKGIGSGQLAEGNCDQAEFVDTGFELGQKLGITGTPSLFTVNGTKYNGYVPHTKLIPMLLNEL